MNLADYTRTKFQIADILRSATRAARAAEPDNPFPFEDLFARLAEDRFNVAVVGQFSRGKTSLMNAMLKTERLPVGVVPLTSVITTVQYGPSERATVEYRERRLASQIALDALPEFVTQKQNPGNLKGIKLVRIELPSELLRKGFYLIDTPGLGSAIAENTRTTEEFLPQADAFVVVTSYESPLSADEMRLLGTLTAQGYRAFLVLNKRDLVADRERADVEEHVRTQLRALTDTPIELFSLSARQALAAARSGDIERQTASGLPAFLDRLVRFLVEERSAEFMRRMFARAAEALGAIEGAAGERQQLLMLQQSLGATLPSSAERAAPASEDAAPPFSRCAVCFEIERAVREFLQTYQYAVIIDQTERDGLHADGGLCSFHTWQYATMASGHGTCVAFPGVLEQLAESLRAELKITDDHNLRQMIGQLPAGKTCRLCQVHEAAERTALAGTVAAIARGRIGRDANAPAVCLPHLGLVVAGLDEAAGRALLARVAASWVRTAEDMRRYALKRDGSRRAFTTQDEIDADLCGLRALAGHRALHFVGRVR
jgi:small GTP-binding protein